MSFFTGGVAALKMRMHQDVRRGRMRVMTEFGRGKGLISAFVCGPRLRGEGHTSREASVSLLVDATDCWDVNRDLA